ncbi:hypothetical protein QNI16_07160 [Cytophagaceae bacterium YF14B1]|uniref:Uncharacterized protein n=1 Tax=Xanthocytophaga flava TaxID=3048013 RepID=A0AAE3U672_9BACT|nr:hypothetical protein [Xanthocytophaga flavus]MDJ1480257.1 hypothetical protein [Xanthocytophaga flavus]
MNTDLERAEREKSNLAARNIEITQELDNKPPWQIRIKLIGERATIQAKLLALEFLISDLQAGQQAEKIQ